MRIQMWIQMRTPQRGSRPLTPAAARSVQRKKPPVQRCTRRLVGEWMNQFTTPIFCLATEPSVAAMLLASLAQTVTFFIVPLLTLPIS